MNLEIRYDPPRISNGRQLSINLVLTNHADAPILNLAARVTTSNNLCLLTGRDVVIPHIHPHTSQELLLKFEIQGDGLLEARLEKLNYRLSGRVEKLPDWPVVMAVRDLPGMDASQVQVIRIDQNELRQNENNRVILSIINESDVDWQMVTVQLRAAALGVPEANLTLDPLKAHTDRRLTVDVCPGVSGMAGLDVLIEVQSAGGVVQKPVHLEMPILKDERGSSTVIQGSVITGQGHRIGGASQGEAFTGVRATQSPVATGTPQPGTCPDCGANIPTDSNFCEKCGHPIDRQN